MMYTALYNEVINLLVSWCSAMKKDIETRCCGWKATPKTLEIPETMR
jgi:hypothetical protein